MEAEDKENQLLVWECHLSENLAKPQDKLHRSL